jgi:hypothetical protein
MRTGNRKPRLNKKPSRGLKMRMHQMYKGMKKAIAKASAEPMKGKFINPHMARQQWLSGFHTTNHRPHQGGQEKARRVRQMAAHKCINPECWT